MARRFADVDGRLIRLDLGKEQGLSYYFVAGGLPIVVDHQLIGAIGVGQVSDASASRLTQADSQELAYPPPETVER